MTEKNIELTDADFKDELAEKNGLLLFYKKICPHCRALKKVLGKVKAVNPDLAVMQINSEENPAAMEAFEIGRVPTLLVVQNGEVQQRKTGLLNAREVAGLLQPA